MRYLETWHHGLVARDWAEFETQVGCFADLIRAWGQPALDLGHGTGVLLPFLQALITGPCSLSAVNAKIQLMKREDGHRWSMNRKPGTTA